MPQDLAAHLAGATGVSSTELLPPHLARHLAAASLAQEEMHTAQAALQPVIGAAGTSAALDLGSWADDCLLMAEVESLRESAAGSAQVCP